MRPPPLLKAGQGRTATDLTAPWLALASLWPGLHRLLAISLLATAAALAAHAQARHEASQAAALALRQEAPAGHPSQINHAQSRNTP